MSADAYRKCPMCYKKHVDGIREMVKRVDQAYGNVPLERFKEMQTELQKAQSIELKETLAEYRDIGIHPDGRFEVKFDANCSVCGFKFDYHYDCGSDTGPWNDDEIDLTDEEKEEAVEFVKKLIPNLSTSDDKIYGS